jgi:disulfide oxidoreductase YuzD
MALEKQVEEHLEILPNGNIQIKQVTKILDDGVVIASNIHRSVVEPGEVVADKSKRIKDIAGAIWTPEIVAENKAQKEAAAAKNGKGPSV